MAVWRIVGCFMLFHRTPIGFGIGLMLIFSGFYQVLQLLMLKELV